MADPDDDSILSEFFKDRSGKAGKPPGSLIHIGERKTDEVTFTVIDYDAEEFTEGEVDTVEDCFAFRDTESVTWINVDGLHEPDVIEGLGDHFNVHPLVREDILNTDQRPKLEEFDDHMFLVLKMFMQQDGDLAAEQVSLILAENTVITFQESPGDVFEPVRERLRKGKGQLRKRGADYLAYSLLDAIVDSYFGVLEGLGEEIERVEDELIEDPDPHLLQNVYSLKQELIFLRKSVWPLRELLSMLQRSDSDLIDETTKMYLRDVYDHTIQVIDIIETFRDLVSGALDVYLSSVSNRMNEVMKVLTIIATIFIPLTFIAGVYGMNFEYMPELAWRWGYPASLGVMALVTAGMIVYFRRKDWL